MNNRAARYGLVVLPFLVMCQPAQASKWEICRLELHVTQVVKQPHPKLQAQVMKVSTTSTTAECPKEGVTLTFIPETPDYQSTLPRRQWPGQGQSMRIDYRYLDGNCKGEGHSYACRIEHYPLARN
ncbi:hypothetical protein IAE35_24600 [Pseudomonas sp. S75]|uniref:hypothetical protein n=1 Tax=unclassified Pseudomonas TaxID=196821 RepID=UPI001908CEB4|nr:MULTISPECIES: hypothetical protein [unclassified Pseudomonas]MBJ9974981.1 hypothetical protein [Pseudomonas sp. S30]MBK0156524.1 hypothetical protein [Pseudomonas sp. S75]